MRRTTARPTVIAGVVAAVLGAAVIVAPQSSATTAVITVGSLGGPAAGPDDSFAATLAPGTTSTFSNGTGGTSGITCASSTVTGTISGDGSGAVDSAGFGNCTSSITGVTGVNSISITGLPLPFTVSANSAVSIPGPTNVTVTLGTLLGPLLCNYTGTNILGTFSNADSSVSFSDQSFTLTSGPSVCPGSGDWTATYVVSDTTAGNQPIYVN